MDNPPALQLQVEADHVHVIPHIGFSTTQDEEKGIDSHATTTSPATTNHQEADPFLVTFAKPIDKHNPIDWPTRTKWTVTGVLSATGFTRIMVSTIMAPALPTIAAELHMNTTEAAMALSVFLLATAFGPILMAPISEIYGRTVVLHASSIWFVIWNLLCGFAKTKGTLITARLMAGFGASSIYALGGGVLGDLWSVEQRGTSLSMYMLIPLLGTAFGPIIGGFLTAGATWRWMFWATSMAQVVLIAGCFIFFRETYGPLILQRRAERLRRNTQNSNYYTSTERQHADRTYRQILQRSLSRPLRLLAFHPIVQIVGLLSAFGYGVLYIALSTFSDLWTSRYHQSTSISGLHYLAVALGEIAGSQLGGPLMDYLYRRLTARYGRKVPEYRIPLMIPGTIIAPLGLLLYGWSAQKLLPWPVVDLGMFITCFGLQISGQAKQAYVIDSYQDHTSSASAAMQFMRSLTAFTFPLFAPTMYSVLGYGWGNTTIALVSVAIGLPAPIWLCFHGARLRAKAASSY